MRRPNLTGRFVMKQKTKKPDDIVTLPVSFFLPIRKKDWYKEFTVKENGCWYVRTRSPNTKTRSSFQLEDGRLVLAARAFKLFTDGPNPDGKRVLHATCGDIFCIRPDHHFWALGKRLPLEGTKERRNARKSVRQKERLREKDDWGKPRDNRSPATKRRAARLALPEYRELLCDVSTPLGEIANRFAVSEKTLRSDAKAMGVEITKPVKYVGTNPWVKKPFSNLELGQFGVYNSVFALGGG